MLYLKLKNLLLEIIGFTKALVLQLFLPTSQEVEILENITPEEFITLATKQSKTLASINANLKDKKSSQHAANIQIYSLFSYHTPIVQQAIWNLKYKGNKKVAVLCAEMLYTAITEILKDNIRLSGSTLPLLIPLPISKERLRERGWNQTEMLAYELSALDVNRNFKINSSVLYKIKHTQPQTKLNRKERLENLKNCFAVSNQEIIRNKNIILLDDVTTTGSTITEAAETLKKAGAAYIIAFTIAQ